MNFTQCTFTQFLFDCLFVLVIKVAAVGRGIPLWAVFQAWAGTWVDPPTFRQLAHIIEFDTLKWLDTRYGFVVEFCKQLSSKR